MNKTELLNRFSTNGEQRVLLARILDKWDQAEHKGYPTNTGFLSPAEQAVSADMLMADHKSGILFGGYEDAERRVWGFLPEWLTEELWLEGEECPVCAVEVKQPASAKLTHRDYLGSLMGLGITREKIGDILLNPEKAQVLVLRETLPILLSQWAAVGRYSIEPVEISLGELQPAKGERKIVHATVASTRLDAVLSSGFSISRNRASELIRAGRVMLNHRLCEKIDRTVQEGDVMTCRGLGKCVLVTVGGTSRKGRTILELERYL